MTTTASTRPVSTVEPGDDTQGRRPRAPKADREHECRPTTEIGGPPEQPTSDQPAPERLAEMTSHLAPILEAQRALLAEVRQLNAQEHILADLQDQCRRYRERFFEREVLDPVLCGLIGLADRIRRDIGRLRTLVAAHPKGTGALALTQVLEMRQADLVEVDAMLAGLGTEPFSHADDRFDASVQTCRGRIVTSKPSHHGRIAERLLPGYRRHDRVVRRELVKVYVTSPINNGVRT